MENFSSMCGIQLYVKLVVVYKGVCGQKMFLNKFYVSPVVQYSEWIHPIVSELLVVKNTQ